MSLARLARSLAHTRPRQLAERAKRVVWQRWHDLAPGVTALLCRGAAPRVAETPPQPLFAPRAERLDTTNGVPCALFLGRTHALRGRIDWRARGAPELERMNLHYMEYLEALDDEDFTRIVLDWIERNPSGARGAWRIAWNSYVLSLRTVVWMQQLAARRGRLGAALVERMHASLGQQLRFLERHVELDIGGNHLVKDAKAFLWAGSYVDGEDARRWRARGAELLDGALAEQILADGMHYERSPAYHAQVFADLVECAHVAAEPLRSRIIARLAPMAQVLVDLTHPDGTPSQFNDGGLHMAYSTAACMDAFERLGGARPAARERIELPEAGYFGVRNGDALLLADCGAIAPDHLPAHGHGDVLAFEWTLAGRRVIVDAGVHEYERGVLRDESRSTLSHNTVSIDEREQCEFWAAFRVGRRARATLLRYERLGRGFVLEGAHDGYRYLRGAPLHVRRFIVGRESLVIDDTIEGGANQSVRARLLLHPDATVTKVGPSLAIRVGKVALLVEARYPMSIVDAHWCPDFGVRLPTKQIVVHYPPAPSHATLRLTRVHASSFLQPRGEPSDPRSAERKATR